MKKAKLFLVHYAGGSCYSFDFLIPYLHRFDVRCLELPGRGKRVREPMLSSALEATNDLLTQVEQCGGYDADTIVYGHSLGAYLGLYLVDRMEKEGCSPRRLVVSGNPGPGINENKTRHDLSKEEFRNELIELGGMPLEVLNNKELYEFYEPILRADFKLADTVSQNLPPVINTSVLSIMGTLEEHADLIGNWATCTKGEFQYQLLEGDHFFIHKHPHKLAQLIIS